MPWPKHRYGYIVLDGQALRLLRSNGDGHVYPGGFGEIYLERRVAVWWANYFKDIFQKLADRDAQNARESWLRYKENTRVLKVALPGSYPQMDFQTLREQADR